MSSLYLGRIAAQDITYHIHAFTNGLPFLEHSSSEISDPTLFNLMSKERFNVLKEGRQASFAAVKLDIEKQREYNPHDDRPGTVHIAALNAKDHRMLCVISVAVDTGEKEHGELIGLPLENRWRKSGYPEGASLDPFREHYLDVNYNSQKPLEPYQMAELYRHFRTRDIDDATVARMGISIGAYQLLITEPRKRNKTETFLWVFDAIIPYFDLYRLASGAVLRDFTIKNPPRYISPNPAQISYKQYGNTTQAYWGEEIISRSVKAIRAYKQQENIEFRLEEAPFLDGLVDLRVIEKAVRESPIELLPLKHEGMTEEDMQKVKASVSIVARHGYEEYHKNNPRVMAIINEYSKALGIKSDFNNTVQSQALDSSK